MCAKRCLVADDSRVIRRVAAKIVQDLGFTPVEAANGQDALAACRAAMPDVILLEWDLTQLCGADVAQAVRSLPGGSAAKVVFCTTRNAPSDIRAGLAAGADEYIMKPFDSEIVASKFLMLGLLT